ncbi:MAG: hypothetical protein J6A79_19425 [Clostridia bacterium]|nr:hypothetical protein [Clostridia bacterium]
MFYNDGFEMDENFRVKECPKCGNEEFSDEAGFCRICGTALFNACAGEDIYDYNGDFNHHEDHKNPGNARFCEICGKPTFFFSEKFLKPFTEIKHPSTERFLSRGIPVVTGSTAQLLSDPDDDGELPF